MRWEDGGSGWLFDESEAVDGADGLVCENKSEGLISKK